MKAMTLYVYRSATLGDCTAGGLSSKHDRILLVGEGGNTDVDPANMPENAFELVRGGGGYMYLKPYGKNSAQYSMGGNFASSSGSPFWELSRFPIPIHDRNEW